jgi:hypothetical protein
MAANDALRIDSWPIDDHLIFEPGTDILRAKVLLQERLTQPQGLPTIKSPWELKSMRWPRMPSASPSSVQEYFKHKEAHNAVDC